MSNDTRQDSNAVNSGEWEKVCTRFAKYYGKDNVNRWLEPCRFEKIMGNIAIINAPTRFIKQHIERDYQEKLQILWQEINEAVTQIKVTIGRSTRNLESDIPQQTAQIIKLPVQLPLWPEATRGTPNSALRGALFAAINPNKRKALQREIIADEMHLKIRFTGWQLDQSDRDVWEMALHMARQQPLGTDIYFTAHGFLKSMGRATGKSQHEWLKDALARLLGCGVEITHNGYTYGGSLLEFEREEDTQRYKLSISPRMLALYSAGWTQTDYYERQLIGNKKFLALWIHGFIASHTQLYPTKVETFYRISGSTNSDMRSFKRQLIRALDHLKDLSLIKDFYLENNLVHIEKYPSKSQMKHLAKKKK